MHKEKELDKKRSNESKHLRRHPLYSTWSNMIQRCENSKNPNYKNYGGRGITVCTSWRNSFECFLYWATTAGHNKGLYLDRANYNGNYEPKNCRFITARESALNRRFSKGKSGFNGIEILPSGRYRSRICFKKKGIQIGIYDKIKDAISARNRYIKENNLNYSIQHL